MFILIEKEAAMDRWKDINVTRESFASVLWNISSIQLNGKNRSMFNEE